MKIDNFFILEMMKSEFKIKMSYPEERLKKYYYEEALGVLKNRKMNGIPVKHKKIPTMVYFYVDGINGATVFGSKFQEKIKRMFKKRVLDEALQIVDYAETITDERNRYEIVEWWSQLRLHQALLKFGLIRRAMRLKIIETTEVKYEFHIVLYVP